MRSAEAQRSDRRAARTVLIAFAALEIVFSGIFPGFANPNELSRVEAVYAFVEDGTFRIDRAVERFGSHDDMALSNGHFYSNKAPGLTFAAIPVYRLLRCVFPPPRTPFDPIWVLLRILVVTSACVGALARFLGRLTSRQRPAPALVAAALAFGTPFVLYSRSFFSHAWTAALILFALDAIGRAEAAGTRRRDGALLGFAGFLAGWAAISEYPLALVAGLLFVRAVARPAAGKRSRRLGRAAAFAGGIAIPLGLLLAYNAACFGSPFVLSSAREALPQYASLAHRGLFGFGFPRPIVALAYLLHPARGLLLFSPFWLWIVSGFVRWKRSGEDAADWSFCLAATILFFLAMTAYPNWHGGWSLGNRYLLPLLFPAGLALTWALDSPLSRWGFAAASVFAAAVHLTMTASFSSVPVEVAWPVANAALWFLARGWAAPGIFGDPPGWAVAAIAIHLLIGFATFAVAIDSAALPRRRAWLAPAAAILIFGASLVWAPSPSFSGRIWRADILGRVSGYDPQLNALREAAARARTPAEKRLADRVFATYGWVPVH